MNEPEHDFRIRPGKPRSARAPRPKAFVDQVLRAANKAGHVSTRTSGKQRSHSNFGRGQNRFGRSRLFSSSRRVMVAARIARHKGRAYRAAPLSTHLAYLRRDGVSRDGEKGLLFDAETDGLDGSDFAARCENDRHHFRFIISPEDAAEMEDLRGFTRDLARRMEADLGTRLDWVAVDHWNTDNPHVHLIVRGVDDRGGDLVIARDYISSGLRSRAEDLVALELGPKPEHEIRHALEREVTAERWTRLDRELRYQADDLGLLDLRPSAPGPADPQIRRLMIGRLQHLRKLGLASEGRPGEWILGLEAERTLRELGERGDIIKTMHRAFAERGQDRGFSDFAIDAGRPGDPIIGRLVATGLHDEQTGTAYAVIDGTDARIMSAFAVWRPSTTRPRRAASSRCAASAARMIRVRRLSWPTAPILTCKARSPRPARPGSIIVWSSDPACRLRWAGSGRRSGTRSMPVQNFWRTRGWPRGRDSGSSCNATFSTPCGGANSTRWARRSRPRQVCHIVPQCPANMSPAPTSGSSVSPPVATR